MVIELKSGDHRNHQDLLSGSHECVKFWPVPLLVVEIYHRISENIACWWYRRWSQGITKLTAFIMRTAILLIVPSRVFPDCGGPTDLWINRTLFSKLQKRYYSRNVVVMLAVKVKCIQCTVCTLDASVLIKIRTWNRCTKSLVLVSKGITQPI